MAAIVLVVVVVVNGVYVGVWKRIHGSLDAKCWREFMEAAASHVPSSGNLRFWSYRERRRRGLQEGRSATTSREGPHCADGALPEHKPDPQCFGLE